MPFKSKKQRSYLYSKQPSVARKFARETPKGSKLPTRAKRKGKR